MINKYLIFRTDRIGDFLLSCVLIKSIKRNDPKSHITVVGSNKNSKYISSFTFIDQVFTLNKGFLSRISAIKKLRNFKFNFSIIHDDKKRSKFINFFLKKEITINCDSSNLSITKINKILEILKILNFNLINDDLNFYQINIQIKEKKIM